MGIFASTVEDPPDLFEPVPIPPGAPPAGTDAALEASTYVVVERGSAGGAGREAHVPLTRAELLTCLEAVAPRVSIPADQHALHLSISILRNTELDTDAQAEQEAVKRVNSIYRGIAARAAPVA